MSEAKYEAMARLIRQKAENARARRRLDRQDEEIDRTLEVLAGPDDAIAQGKSEFDLHDMLRRNSLADYDAAMMGAGYKMVPTELQRISGRSGVPIPPANAPMSTRIVHLMRRAPRQHFSAAMLAQALGEPDKIDSIRTTLSRLSETDGELMRVGSGIYRLASSLSEEERRTLKNIDP